MLSAQVSSALAKNLFASARPQDVLALRLLLGGAILCAFYRTWQRAVTRHSLVAVGACAVSLFLLNGLFYLAIQRLDVGVTVALEFIGPLGLAVATTRRWLDLIWVALAALGLLLLDVPRLNGRVLDPTGVLLALAAGGAWAGYIVAGRWAGRIYGTGSAAPTMAGAGLLALPLALGGFGGAPSLVPALPRIAVIGVLSSALPVALEMAAMPKLSARSYSVFTCLAPAIAALAGWIVAGERLDAGQVIAIALVTAAAAGSAASHAGGSSGSRRSLETGQVEPSTTPAPADSATTASSR